MSNMSFFILNATVFYLVSWVYHIINDDDILLMVCRNQINLDDNSLAESIKDFDNKTLRDEISKLGDKPFKRVVEILDELDEKNKKHEMMDSDEEYRKSIVLKCRRELKFYYAVRRVKLSILLFFRELYVLIPAFILIATGSLFMPLVASIIIMTIFAIKREDDVFESIEHYHGKEIANKSSVRFSVFLTVLIEAFLKQWYVYVYLILKAIF